MSKDMRAFRGSLDVYYQLYDDTDTLLPTVYRGGNITEFSITPDSEEMEVISTGNEDYGQAADAMVDAKPTKCSFTANRFNVDNMGLVHMGQISELDVSEQSVTDEVVAFVHDEIFQVANGDISAVTVKNEAGDTTYVAGTDYEIVDAALGLIKPLSSGGITDGTAGKVSYTAAAVTGWKIDGGVKSSRFVRIFGRGVNRFNNKRTIIEIPRGSIKPSGSFSMVGTEAASMGYDVTITVPTDGSAPYTIKTDA